MIASCEITKRQKPSSKVWIKAQNSISSCLASIVRFAMYVAWETGGKGKPGVTWKGRGTSDTHFGAVVAVPWYAGYPGGRLRASDHMSCVLCRIKVTLISCVNPSGRLSIFHPTSVRQICTSEYVFAYCIAGVKNGRKERSCVFDAEAWRLWISRHLQTHATC